MHRVVFLSQYPLFLRLFVVVCHTIVLRRVTTRSTALRCVTLCGFVVVEFVVRRVAACCDILRRVMAYCDALFRSCRYLSAFVSVYERSWLLGGARCTHSSFAARAYARAANDE